MRHRIRVGSCIVIAAVLFITPRQSRSQGHWEYRDFEHDGMTRGYHLYVPDLYDGSEPRPLVLGFETWYAPTYLNMARVDRMLRVADTANVLVAYPEAEDIMYPANGVYIGPGWNVDGSFGTLDDVDFIRQVIEAIQLNYAVDPTRIHAAGYSFGAHMAFTLSCQLADVIASVAGVSGILVDRWHEPGECSADRPVSVLQMHGTDDKTQPYEGFYPGPSAYNGDYAETPAYETARFWAERNHCATGPVVTDLPDVDPDDGTWVTMFQWSDCDAGTEVIHYQIEGGGHTWPGREPPIGGPYEVVSYDVDATPIVWEFLLRNPLAKVTIVDDDGTLPESARLHPNYPNPFNGSTTMVFELPDAADVRLSLVDPLGRVFESLEAGHRAAGRYEIRLNLAHRPAGVYFGRLEVAGRVITRPMVHVRQETYGLR